MEKLFKVMLFASVVLVAVMLSVPDQAFALTEQWKYASSTYKNSVLIDAQGNSYVVESRYQEGILTKLTPDGQVVWQFSGKSYGDSMDNNVSVDKDGNVFVHVTQNYPPHYWNFTTIKLSPNGEVLFSAAFTAAKPSGKVVPDNNTGNFSVVVEQYDTFQICAGSYIMKYDSAGNFLSRVDYPAEGFVSVECDDLGNFYVGSFDSATSSGSWVRKFQADGTPLWFSSVTCPDLIVALKLDSNRNVVAMTPTVVEKFDAVSGNSLWTVTNAANAYNSEIALDSSNNVYLVGNTTVRGLYAGTIDKIGANGTRIWETLPKGTTTCGKVAINKSNTILYVASEGSVITVSPSKGRISTQTASGYDAINSMIFDNTGYLFMTGNIGNVGDVIKYAE